MKTNTLTAAIAATLALATGSASAQVSDNLVKIGVLTDMSGAYSDLAGAGAVEAVKMAVEDFKAKEKPAYAIEVVYADIGSGPAYDHGAQPR